MAVESKNKKKSSASRGTSKNNNKMSDTGGTFKNNKSNAGGTSKSKKSNNNGKLPGKKNNDFAVYVLTPALIGLLGLFCVISLICPSLCGMLGTSVASSLKGCFGAGCVLVVAYLFSLAILWKKFLSSSPICKCICGLGGIVFFTSFMSGIVLGAATEYTVGELFEYGNKWLGGGVVGGALAQLMGKYVNIFAPFLNFVLFVSLALLSFGVTPSVAYEKIKKTLTDIKHERDENAKSKRQDEEKEERYLVFDEQEESEEEPEDFEHEIKRKKRSMPDLTKKEAEAEIELARSMRRTHGKTATPMVYDFSPEGGKSEYTGDKLHDTVEKKFLSDEPNDLPFELDEETGEVTEKADIPKPPETDEPKISYYEPVKSSDALVGEQLKVDIEPLGESMEEIAGHEYIFPPITLLKEPEDVVKGDISSELEANAKKLIGILESFNVRATVTHISYGPTITRYEVKPAPGVRVSSISKLVDDISMSFATMGVRIEAPIPGKEAVGIEVPNKDVSVVRIRELLQTEAFEKAESKLYCALGKDVVGEPVYFDIAKMPHILIAGATGMGKSVCINSIITSILYKASPDEVKLILIDPKKVEFVPYSGLPHLLVPVVSDPKKAAGALHWAVSEMERRYDMIESVGVRNIFGYNKATENDPEKERLAQVVIIIDEFADLMMVAKQDVEESICRLAQKARAAGMHLVIGTQRPSVDVITGLIKANVPSRISCKTSSQIDSRTILDTAGAEKLIGRGDMLFAPVGISKPRRVQGAFVSDSEVEAVTDFIKKHMGDASYSDDVMEKIEKEASSINGKRDSFGEDEDEDIDELFVPAVEILIEEGRASTSLLQRRLSIGYGRAAKIIDKMQDLGICSEAVGNKPRRILLSKEEFYEMYDRQ